MNGLGVIPVDTVLDEELPVGFERVLVGSLQDRDAIGGLIGCQIDEIAGVAEVRQRSSCVRASRCSEWSVRTEMA